MKGKHIILGVTGGIAAYKAVYLLREFQKAGAEVRVVMTPSATRFVGTETFASLSRSDVPVHVFNESSGDIQTQWSKHIHWAEWADLLVIAPCTANTLGKLVHGLSDNMLTTTALAVRCPVLLCPTMDGGMYRSAAVRRNIELARNMGMHVLEPDSGYLASGLHDEGRLPEADLIFAEAQRLLNAETSNDNEKPHLITGAAHNLILKGKRVLVTAGPTREYIDAVRFISNPSTGKMGVAMAIAAKKLGAEVTLIHGQLSTPLPDGIKTYSVVSAGDMFEQVKKLRDTSDIIVMAAAVSDFTPVKPVTHKIKKSEASDRIELKPTTDILKWLGVNRSTEEQVLIGFAMETDNLEAETERKLRDKKCDWIVGNLLNADGSGFGSNTNHVLVKGPSESFLASGTKEQVSIDVLTRIFG